MQKLPKNRKRLSGTNRPDKDRQGLKPGRTLIEAPPVPEMLSERAGSAWMVLAPELVAVSVLTTADLPALALLCETQATVAELEQTIREEGFTVESAAGTRKAHPALKSLESTRNAAMRLMCEFGLTPKSRKYVEKAPTDSNYNPYDHLEDDFVDLNDDESGGFQSQRRGFQSNPRGGSFGRT